MGLICSEKFAHIYQFEYGYSRIKIIDKTRDRFIEKDSFSYHRYA